MLSNDILRLITPYMYTMVGCPQPEMDGYSMTNHGDPRMSRYRHYMPFTFKGSTGEWATIEGQYYSQPWDQCCATFTLIGVLMNRNAPSRYGDTWSTMQWQKNYHSYLKMPRVGEVTKAFIEGLSIMAMMEQVKSGNPHSPLLNVNSMLNQARVTIEEAKQVALVTLARHAILYHGYRLNKSSLSAMSCKGSDLHVLMDAVGKLLALGHVKSPSDTNTGTTHHYSVHGEYHPPKWFRNRNGGRLNSALIAQMDTSSHTGKVKGPDETTRIEKVQLALGREGNDYMNGNVGPTPRFYAFPWGWAMGKYTSDFDVL